MLFFDERRLQEKGNALFLILIAVALFAALSYAITQSGRGGGSLDKENTLLYASRIIQQAAALKTAAMRMNFTGTSYTQIVTNNPTNAPFSGGGTLNSLADPCTTGADCLFAPEGGGAAVPSMPRAAFMTAMPALVSWLPSYFAGAGSFNGWHFAGLTPGATGSNVAVQDIGTTANDDVLLIYPLKAEVCAEIDRKLGFSSMPAFSSFNSLTTAPGQETACLADAGQSFYFFYQVIYAR